MPARPPQRRKSYLDRGQPHELTFGCYHGYRFLERERVCLWLADSITRVKQELGMAVWAYVFMPNHVHLVVHFGNAEVELARALRGIKWPVARKAIAFLRRSAPEWLPKLQAGRGRKLEYHFWQRGGGYDRNITEPATLEQVMRYIHLNPVRKGLVDRATDWKWSSAQWYAAGTGPLAMDPVPPPWTVGMTPDS